MRAAIADTFRRVAFQRSFAHRPCSHLADVEDRTSTVRACPSCTARGSRWVHLRMCQTCGAIGCCDSSGARHARAHFEATGHPIIRSIEPGEDWRWCYFDETFV